MSIKIKNLFKSFGEKEVLKDINVEFEVGKSNMIIGGSGSGKTVLMKCIVGLMEPTSGKIMYDDMDFVSMKGKDKRNLRVNLGMLFQYSALFDSMSVADNVAFPLRMFSTKSPKEIKKRVDFCLDRVNLPDAALLLPDEISGGMKKRVGIARAIALNPKYLFCDEPNSGLDPITAAVIDELIKEITEEFKTTTVINTHDMKSVMDFGDNIIFLKDGVVQWKGTNDELRVSDDEVLNGFVNASQFLDKDHK
ncbi:MAG: ATP-binding cassette domain-containing protein [Bacteroidota bacterium]|nr:ATP-binding cassette domain-containing protein [Bacteroidota bacterium]